MEKLEILCTTMYQRDFSKIQEMNLSCNVLFTNQADHWAVEAGTWDNHRARMITTDTRGVSKNRNLAIANRDPEADIVVFSDDDLRFYADSEEKILAEFARHPEAEAIKFNIHCVSQRKISMKPIENFHKAGRREAGSWGVCALAVRAPVLRKGKLRFSERFGPGTSNYCGEDTIFLQEMFRKNVKLYASPVCIADIDQSVSCWFTGYGEQYFRTCGMVLQECYPGICWLLAFRSAWRFYRRLDGKTAFWDLIKWYGCGIRKNRKERQGKHAETV